MFGLRNRLLIVVLAAVAVCWISSHAQAAPISVDSGSIGLSNGYSMDAEVVGAWQAANGGQVPVDVANDLLINHLQAGSPTYSGSMTYSSHLENIHDGLMVANYGGGGMDNSANVAIFSNGGDLIFNLDGPHDLGRIDAFTGRGLMSLRQEYDVATSTDGGATWTPLISVYYPGINESGYGVRRVSVLDDQGGLLATGVNALKFTIYSSSANDSYFEIAAYETPEPATLSLLALGGLALIRRRK